MAVVAARFGGLSGVPFASLRPFIGAAFGLSFERDEVSAVVAEQWLT